MALAGSGLTTGRLWLLYSWLCSWLLFIMLFMALCISSSMRCFSRFGIRPKRTAEEREEKRRDYRTLLQPLASHLIITAFKVKPVSTLTTPLLNSAHSQRCWTVSISVMTD